MPIEEHPKEIGGFSYDFGSNYLGVGFHGNSSSRYRALSSCISTLSEEFSCIPDLEVLPEVRSGLSLVASFPYSSGECSYKRIFVSHGASAQASRALPTAATTNIQEPFDVFLHLQCIMGK